MFEPSMNSTIVVATCVEFVAASLSVNVYAAEPMPDTELAVTCCAPAWLCTTAWIVAAVAPASVVPTITRFAPLVGSSYVHVRYPAELCTVGSGYADPAADDTAAPVGQVGSALLPEEVAAAALVGAVVDPAAPLDDVDAGVDPHAASIAPHASDSVMVSCRRLGALHFMKTLQ